MTSADDLRDLENVLEKFVLTFGEAEAEKFISSFFVTPITLKEYREALTRRIIAVELEAEREMLRQKVLAHGRFPLTGYPYHVLGPNQRLFLISKEDEK
jgi:hypothetical protein